MNFGFGKGPDGIHDLEMLTVRGGHGGVGRRLEEEADVTLVLDRCEFLPREQIERPGGDHDQHGRGDDAPAHLQRAVEQPCISAAHQRRTPRFTSTGQPAFLAVRVHESRAHHRRERHRDDTRQHHGRGERDGELEEQRAGQAALESDRRVDRRQGDRHRDDRTDQLAGARQRRLDPRLALSDVPLDVLHDHDRVVDHQTDRQHDGEDASSRFRLKPNANMKMAAPISDTGIATSGTSAVRTEPMKRKTTSATIRIVSDKRLGDLGQRILA